jgi:carboxypeptidase Q
VSIAAAVSAGHVSENVVVRIPGRTDQWVAVVAHFDSWHLSECAADNALGVAMLVQLGEMIVQTGQIPERGVLLLATAGEEQGLQGALAWTAANDELARAVSHVITLDIPWSPEGTHRCAASDPAWAAQAAAAMEAEGLPAVALDGPSPASDHLPFQTREAAALWCSRQPYRGYHTFIDTLDRIDMDEAAASARAHGSLLRSLAGL